MAHSLVGASSAYRWFECPGSVALIAKQPPQPSSKYAREGLAAHELARICLSKKDEFTEDWLGETIEIEGEEVKVTQGMIDAVDAYLEVLGEDADKYGLTVRQDIVVEKSFELTDISKDASGTNDAYLYVPFKKLIVYDYKHGAGVWVNVINNKQLLYYALGAVKDIDIGEVEIVIVQPRCGDPDDIVRRQTISMKALNEFKVELKERIAATKDPKALLKAGEHCKFCPAMLTCKEITNKRDNMALEDFNDLAVVPMTVEKIGGLLKDVNVLEVFITRLREHAFSLAESGKEIPGYKLVKKRSNRTWINMNEVISYFHSEHGDDIYDKKLLSPAKMEKLVGKKNMGDLTEQKDAGNKLVPNTDKGESVKGSALSDFSQEGEFEL